MTTDQPADVEAQAASFEEALNDVLRLEGALTDDQRDNLSKVLFPDTHTEKITVGGKERTLRPLTVKFARRVHTAVLPFTKKAEEASQSEAAFTLDDDTVSILYDAAKILSEYYGWDDIPKLIEEEDILLGDLQSLVVQQQALQGENDFLLVPLRLLIKLMRVREILSQLALTSRASGRSTSDSQPSLTDGTVPSTS
jgi:hypothetical protein